MNTNAGFETIYNIETDENYPKWRGVLVAALKRVSVKKNHLPNKIRGII